MDILVLHMLQYHFFILWKLLVCRYTQNFDLEGESGIVVRSIGTAVSLAKLTVGQGSPAGLSPGALKEYVILLTCIASLIN